MIELALRHLSVTRIISIKEQSETQLSIPLIPGDIIECRTVTSSWRHAPIETWETAEVLKVDQPRSRISLKMMSGTQYLVAWYAYLPEYYRLKPSIKPISMELTSPGVGFSEGLHSK